ncbi:hypothetical protein CRG98_048915, partial [Punica granatum]
MGHQLDPMIHLPLRWKLLRKFRWHHILEGIQDLGDLRWYVVSRARILIYLQGRK